MKKIDKLLMNKLQSQIIKMLFVIIFISKTGVNYSNTIIRDTTMFFFIESCETQSLNNCWYARDNHHDFILGGYEYDIVHRRIKYEEGFYFLGSSRIVNFLKKEEILKMNYMEFIVNNYGSLGLAIEFMGYELFKKIRNVGVFTYPYLLKTQKKIIKKRRNIQKKYKHNSEKNIGPNKGRLYYVKLKYFVDDINLYSPRQILNIDETGELVRPFVKTISTKGKFITEIRFISPY